MKYAFLLSLLVGSTAASLPAINVTGNAFLNSETGERFYIRGVDYQPGGSSNLTDPLADVDVCSRDIPYFKDLGLNTIRVYSVDNTLSHSECMEKLADAGIYLILDVTTPGTSISRSDPNCSYNADFLQNIFATVDAFANYTNVLGFFAGNEVVNNEDVLFTAPYIKATVRDLKKYIKARDYRQIPVGYSAADVASVRLELAEYLNCGNDSTARIDMLGINDYSWCGHSSFTQSGYSEKVKMYSGFSVPMFLSEYGCNTQGTREFTEVASIYSTQMSSVFSGGLVYEYSQEDSDYGLVKIDGDSVSPLEDYNNLRSMLNSTSDPQGTGGYSTSYKPSKCPTDWNFTITVPDTPEDAQTYFDNGAGAGYGFEAETQESCDNDDLSSVSSQSVTSAVSSTASSSSTKPSSSSSSSSTTSSSSSKGVGGQVQAGTFFSVFMILSALLIQ
ncbi:hypothetical protein KL930_000312 [Ogataea haglerorum]|uniref:1,3-beta-glucanosyltransferase n=1 Tax=Ogataea haglerorum TaxID=1937702 RepID=A0AAN6D611_9ASCO|nr:uncharacterized protein KL911_000819 [Ogataea haglerorum]KAG7697633.1 hypothetical protein KL951_002207 [Ogataea haglerorum]KAG7701234.1 hypothetical protein KL915_000265 [Ogataea haglerorum]KAG7709192.1 hypothetical protein KL914_001582 [Ogataea haglerorum]KAG7715320.1 hypothetical protein KL913_004152 [Ogataea haglerorum]KAG7715817.1 hypothetical protein KL949_004234 [Ogataea haglerorum]